MGIKDKLNRLNNANHNGNGQPPKPARSHHSSPTAPGAFHLKRRTVRFAAYAITAIDAVISYRGLLAVGYPQQESITLALMILCFQIGVAAWLTSGAPIGEQFSQRFFEDTGTVGHIKRSIGILILLLGAGFYLVDVLTNYWALTNGAQEVNLANLPAIVLAIALAIGDEVLATIADFLDLSADAIEKSYREQVDPNQLETTYQRSYRNRAQQLAKELGEAHAETWQPTTQFSQGGQS